MNIMNFVTRDVICVAPHDSLDKAMSLMEEFRVHHLVVRAASRVVGMLSDRDVLLSVGWVLSSDRKVHSPARTTVIGPRTVDEIMSRNVLCVENSDSGQAAARLMVDRKIGALPVLHNDNLLGIVTESDLMFWLDKLGATGGAAATFLGQPISTLMRANVLTVSPQTALGDIIDLFRRRRIRHVPVVSGERVLGMISDRDVRKALGESSIRDMMAQESGDYFVAPRVASELMTANVFSVPFSATLRGALSGMLDHRVHSLPVMDGDRLVGIVTQTDFVKAIARDGLL